MINSKHTSSEVNRVFRIICDESCHLETDKAPVMAIGALHLESQYIDEISDSIRNLKIKHKINPKQELKWNNISPSKSDLYLEIVDLFIEDPRLSFRVVAAYKEGLDHENFNQSHSEWFFKIYKLVILNILRPNNIYEIFIDKVDTLARFRASPLKERLNKELKQDVVKYIQVTDSKRSPLMQITDLLIGAITYSHRNLSTNTTKLKIIEKLQSSLGVNLNTSTIKNEKKFNIFYWDLGKK